MPPLRLHPLAPVIGLDIDGTIGDYHSHFIWFLNNIYFPNEAERIRPYWGTDVDGEFSDALNISKADYRAAKLAYRLGGLKRSLPIFRGDGGPNAIRKIVQDIRSNGIQVWICTQRPWLALTSVDSDTQYWLDRNVGKVDGLIYGEEKYHDLVDIVGEDRILGVVDDLPECLDEAKSLGLSTAMRIGLHNEHEWTRFRETTVGFKNAIEIPHIARRWKEGTL